jgi:hypothetical protein
MKGGRILQARRLPEGSAPRARERLPREIPNRAAIAFQITRAIVDFGAVGRFGRFGGNTLCLAAARRDGSNAKIFPVSFAPSGIEECKR